MSGAVEHVCNPNTPMEVCEVETGQPPEIAGQPVHLHLWNQEKLISNKAENEKRYLRISSDLYTCAVRHEYPHSYTGMQTPPPTYTHTHSQDIPVHINK